jgi:hypothetical protein
LPVHYLPSSIPDTSPSVPPTASEVQLLADKLVQEVATYMERIGRE